MGCVSSSLLNQDEDFSHLTTNFTHHIVSLTSTTYGLLTMEPPAPVEPPPSRRKTLSTLFPSEPHSFNYDSINSWDLLDYHSFAKKRTSQLDKDPVFDEKYVSLVDEENSFLKKPISPLRKDRIFDEKNVSLIEEFDENSFSKIPTSPLPKDRVFDEKYVSLIEKFDETSFSKIPTSPLPKDRILDGKNVNLIEKIEGTYRLEKPTSELTKGGVFDEKIVSRIEKFNKICPPNGENKVVMYSTTLRGVRKTFEDCNAVRAAVEGHGVLVSERDVSMDRGFREELKGLIEGEVTLPRLFVKGRYIGGVEEVMGALEEGYLGELLEGLPKIVRGYVCEGCGGARFLPCFTCSGSCKRVVEGVKDGVELDGKEVNGDVVVKCGDCNENGLVHCPVCT